MSFDNVLDLLYDMCRLCLERMGSVNIFTDTSLVDEIADCSGVRIVEHSKLPNTVCNVCIERLRVCKSFREIVTRSHKRLQTLRGGHTASDEEPETSTTVQESSIKKSEEFPANSTQATEESTENEGTLSGSKIRVAVDIFAGTDDDQSSVPKEKIIRKRRKSESSTGMATDASDKKKKSIKKEEDYLWIKPKTEAELTCDLCGKLCSTSKALYHHRRAHEKRFVCQICSKMFSYKNDLTKHVRTHTGEKPFACELCDKSFTQSGTLKAHLEGHRRRSDLVPRVKRASDEEDECKPNVKNWKCQETGQFNNLIDNTSGNFEEEKNAEQNEDTDLSIDKNTLNIVNKNYSSENNHESLETLTYSEKRCSQSIDKNTLNLANTNDNYENTHEALETLIDPEKELDQEDTEINKDNEPLSDKFEIGLDEVDVEESIKQKYNAVNEDSFAKSNLETDTVIITSMDDIKISETFKVKLKFHRLNNTMGKKKNKQKTKKLRENINDIPPLQEVISKSFENDNENHKVCAEKNSELQYEKNVSINRDEINFNVIDEILNGRNNSKDDSKEFKISNTNKLGLKISEVVSNCGANTDQLLGDKNISESNIAKRIFKPMDIDDSTDPEKKYNSKINKRRTSVEDNLMNIEHIDHSNIIKQEMCADATLSSTSEMPSSDTETPVNMQENKLCFFCEKTFKTIIELREHKKVHERIIKFC